MFTDNMNSMEGVGDFGRRKKKKGLFGKLMRVSAGVATGGASELLIRRQKAKKKRAAARKAARRKVPGTVVAKLSFQQRRAEMMARKKKADIEARTRKMTVELKRKLKKINDPSVTPPGMYWVHVGTRSEKLVPVIPSERALVTPAVVPSIAPPVRISPPPPIPSMSEETFMPPPAPVSTIPFIPPSPVRPSAFKPEEDEGEWVEEGEDELPEEEGEWVEEGEDEGVLEGLYFVNDNDAEYISQGAKFMNPQPQLSDYANNSKEVLINSNKISRGPKAYPAMNKAYRRLGISSSLGYLPTFDERRNIIESYGPPGKLRNEYGFLEGSLSGFGKKGRKTMAVGLTAIAALIGYGLYKRYQDKKAAALKAEQDAIELQKAGDIKGANNAKVLASRYNLEVKQLETQIAQQAKTASPEIQAQIQTELQPISFFQQYKIPLLLAGALSVGMYLYKRGGGII